MKGKLIVLALSNLIRTIKILQIKLKIIVQMEDFGRGKTFSVVRVLLATSQTTRPKAYMSAALNDSKLDLFRVSSKT